MMCAVCIDTVCVCHYTIEIHWFHCYQNAFDCNLAVDNVPESPTTITRTLSIGAIGANYAFVCGCRRSRKTPAKQERTILVVWVPTKIWFDVWPLTRAITRLLRAFGLTDVRLYTRVGRGGVCFALSACCLCVWLLAVRVFVFVCVYEPAWWIRAFGWMTDGDRQSVSCDRHSNYTQPIKSSVNIFFLTNFFGLVINFYRNLSTVISNKYIGFLN